jgi:outer membrane protein OmpA-like peptidoglycan-associated protein
MDLPAIMINGKNRHRAYQRLLELRRGPVGVGLAINAGNKDAPRIHRYSAAIPYEPWMKEAALAIREGEWPLVEMSYETVADSMQDLTPPSEQPYRDVQLNFMISFKEPAPEPVKTRSETGKAYLDFAAGSTVLNPYLNNNAAELVKIGAAIQNIKNNPAITITAITFDGYASPDGAASVNRELSGMRAMALKEYIRTVCSLENRLFRVSGKGEDWTAFAELMSASYAAYREQALDIISSTDSPDVRERRLAALPGGAYRDMSASMFPRLRRTDYGLQYTVAPFTVEDGKRMLETSPSWLSLSEMYAIAQTYQAGSAEFQRMFNIAVETFPDSDVACFNAAANALATGNTAAAQMYLDKVTNRDAACENNMGVLAAMQGDYDAAAAHFARAAEGANAEAARNIAETNKLKQE